jgi:hypothetical protein
MGDGIREVDNMVLQFAGFVGGWQNPGFLPPTSAAVLCTALTTWGTFLPSFFFILAGGLAYRKILRQALRTPTGDSALQLG